MAAKPKTTKTNNHPNRGRPVPAASSGAEAAVLDQHSHTYDAEYERFIAMTRDNFHSSAASGEALVVAKLQRELWDDYIAAVPPDMRSWHQCRACQRFLERFGAVCTVSDSGDLVPAMWKIPTEAGSAALGPYDYITRSMNAAVRRSGQVSGAFMCSEATLGEPTSPVPGGRPWKHLYAVMPEQARHRSPVQSASQRAAELAENVKDVRRAIGEWSPGVLNQGVALLQEGGQLRGSEKYRAPAEWLRDLQASVSAAHTVARKENLVWKAVGKAPKGYCHPRASVLGSLMDDIKAGRAFPQIKRNWDNQTDPLIQGRPQAAPAEANVRRAEVLFDKLGLQPSLGRRAARLDEVTPNAVWLPRPPKKAAKREGIFADVPTKGAAPAAPASVARSPTVTMTWEKFKRVVMPRASSIRMTVGEYAPYYGLVTASDMSAPPIIRWDDELERNPVTWYTYTNHEGLLSRAWDLRPGSDVEVLAIAPLPPNWGSRPAPHLGSGDMLVLAGCRDLQGPQLCLFPDFLREELREVRATIEAFSKSNRMQRLPASAANASGVCLRPGFKSTAIVTAVDSTTGVSSRYLIDRWD